MKVDADVDAGGDGGVAVVLSSAAPMRLTVLCAFLAACSGSQPPPPREEPPSDEAPLEIEGPPKPWADMSYDERKDYMMRTVRPTMAKVFRAFDQDRFANFSCRTCHGTNAHEKQHAMPSDLPPLWPTGSPQQRETVDRHPKLVKFMFNEVRPTMRDLLGQEDFDPETGTGFGCFNCHPHGDQPQTQTQTHTQMQTDPGPPQATDAAPALEPPDAGAPLP